MLLTNQGRFARTARGKAVRQMKSLRLTPDHVRTQLPETSATARIAELEHLLALERARREAIEQGLDRLSTRCGALARENAALRDMVPAGAALPV
jgi:hypothetical protein